MITRYALSPFNELQKLQREMNRLFNDYEVSSETYPAVNIWANNEKAYISAEIPGVKTEDLNITVNKNELTISGEKKRMELKDNVCFQRRETGSGSFQRTIRLPFDVENETVKAEYKDGVLNLELSRTEASKPRKITVVNG